jgi:choline dehydrogenase-like flavoprotein
MMFVDSRELSTGHEVETDLCVIGAGAAGITLAREFLGQDMKVCLLDGGGFDADESTQDLYRGENTGLDNQALHETRFRYFGGSTGIEGWGGWSLPFGELDFETRPWVDHSGWPIDRSDLNPYYVRAQEICGLGPFDYDLDSWISHLAGQLTVPDLNDGRVTIQMCQLGPPVFFGSEYRHEFAQQGNVDVYLYANVVGLETTDAGDHITSVRVRTLTGIEFRVSAKQFVLAAGGVENARLLLVSDRVHPAGLGNSHDLVGRFFMDNPRIWSGEFIPAKPVPWLEFFNPYGELARRPQKLRATYHKSVIAGALALSEDVQRQEGLVGYRAWLSPFYHAQGSRGWTSLRRLVWDLKKRRFPKKLPSKLWEILTDSRVPRGLYGHFMRPRRKGSRRYMLVNILENDPNPESRVSLSDERDALGVPRVRVHWEVGPLVRRTLRRAHELIGEELEASGLGRLAKPFTGGDDEDWGVAPLTAWHHMGTTRMHDDPARGVVDRNCRIHDVDNLFVAGSSVFPTAGPDMPTLTIVALALRLAEHLRPLFEIENHRVSLVSD